ncbi:MAG: winged helix-turn-helix transcriptional regulator [Anaerolineaceae bacterium]|nr:winged helix-turn-helix transcriptional regulator [Anaerolineaceae bacterium]
MKSTREKIMRTLLAFPSSTINDLAEAVGINGISIRHHLISLEADDLVTSSEERHGVGRPHLVYSLTDKGIEQFPSGYLRLAQRILETLKDKLSKAEIEKVFEKIGNDIAAKYGPELEDKNTEERIQLLESVLSKEGFIVEWEKEADAITLVSLSCPYLRIGLEHPEICALDNALISAFVAEPIEATTCLLNNDDRCTYRIPLTTQEK